MSGIKKIWAIMHERITNRKRCKFGRFSYTLGCNFEGNNLIASNTVLRNSYLGYGSYVGKKSELNGAKIGRYKKLIPTLQIEPNSIIVTADDDIYYRTDWLSGLYKAHLQDVGGVFNPYSRL